MQLRKIGLTIVVIVAMRFVASWTAEYSPYIKLVITKDLDPSQMFYTESKEVLKAEKEVFQNISDPDR